MTVSDVVAVLVEQGGYVATEEPLHVADLSFEFDAVLRGPDGENGLVVILDGRAAALGPLRRRLAAFRTVLERTGVQRPITVALLATGGGSQDFEALRSVCRVVELTPEEDLSKQLRPLLPLKVPKPVEATEPAMEALRIELGRSVKNPLVLDILRASKKGENEVRDAVRAAVGDLCAGALEGEAEPEDGPDDR